MDGLNDFIGTLNGLLFSDYTVYALLATGVLFTIWSGFGQFRALTHGVAVVRGKYDDKNDPGAINHFQALSAALSATVGLGNIAGVALAVALGGPGAVLWMWIIGILGMAIKMTEVTQSMLYRNTDDPDNPHGGPMFVVKKGFERWGLGPIGTIIGGIFVVTLITSAITGGNMFQAWSVADITNTYFQVPQVATGAVLAIVAGLVIIGGIKRIGAVAGRIVPFMCIVYVIAALFVLAMNIGEVPAMLALIVTSGLPDFLGGSSPDATGAFLGGTFGYAAMWGVKRALFSSEAGQGSSPIAHSAAKTDEPVREGVVAGLEPFIDTIVVCTLTALVILSTGAYNRGPETNYEMPEQIELDFASDPAGALVEPPAASIVDGAIQLASIDAPDRFPTQGDIKAQEEDGTEFPGWATGDNVFIFAVLESRDRVAIPGQIAAGEGGGMMVDFAPRGTLADGSELPAGAAVRFVEPNLFHGNKPAWTVDTGGLPPLTPDNRDIRNTPEGESGWRNGENVFVVVSADADNNTGRNFRKIMGTVKRLRPDDAALPNQWIVEWKTLESNLPPTLRTLDDGSTDLGIYADYAGASLTGYAFDRTVPGLGKWLVTIAAWLFAISTMISWSYYGEQGIYYLFQKSSKGLTNAAILIYKLIYCALILLTTVAAMPIITQSDGTKTALIGTSSELDMWTTLGLGVMLVANIPIMLIFGAQAMKAYHSYIRKLKSGELSAGMHDAPAISDVVEGKDVE